MQGIDLEAVIQCTSRLTSAATRNAALLLLSKLASLRPKETLEVTLQVLVLCDVPLLPSAISIMRVTFTGTLSTLCVTVAKEMQALFHISAVQNSKAH